MKNLTYATAIVMALTTTSVFAHHAAEGMVDDATYDTIDENLSNSPHDELELDDVGNSMDQVVDQDRANDMTEASADADDAMDDVDTFDTIVLMEDINVETP